MSLAVLCPSRGRPLRAAKMLRSALATTTVSDVLLYVDSDDLDLRAYQQLASAPRTRLLIGNPIGRGAAINELIRQAPGYAGYLVISDDVGFVRSGWDREVLGALANFPNGIGCAHLASETGERYVNWAAVSPRWIETLGWFNYPKCGMFCQDTVIQILAEALGVLTFIEPQVIEHDCLVGEKQLELFAADTAAFLWYCANEFGSDLEKLRAAIRGGADASTIEAAAGADGR